MALDKVTTGVIADDAVTTAKLDTNIAVAGTLGVTGNTTLTGTLTGGASSNIAINSDKFTVAAASGNTVIAGTSTLTGASTHTGGLLTDTIGERTSTTGVTIDSLKIKDGAHHLTASNTGIFRSNGSTVVLSEDGSNVATLDNVTLGSSVVFPAGSIVNCVFAMLATADIGTDSTSYVEVSTALRLALTPTSPNKVLLVCSGGNPRAGASVNRMYTTWGIINPANDGFYDDNLASSSAGISEYRSTDTNDHTGGHSFAAVHTPAASGAGISYGNLITYTPAFATPEGSSVYFTEGGSNQNLIVYAFEIKQ